MGVFDFYKKVYYTISIYFSHKYYFLVAWKHKNNSAKYRKLATSSFAYNKEGGKENVQIKKDTLYLSKQIEDLKQAMKVREEFTKQLKERYQESLTHVRELMEISNKLAEKSKDLFFDNCEIKILNLQVEQALKSLESGCFIPLAISKFNLHDLIDETTTIFILEMRKKNSQILTTVKDKKLYMQSDSLLLKRIFIYLLTKAFLRLPKNGKIEIESRVVKGNAMIRLCDNGYFLDKDISDALFNDKENNFMSEESFVCLVRELKGKVDFAHASKEKHETILWFPLKWEEDEFSRA
ncbi:MAG TPA: hypothetical protein VMW10_01955 [Alphaproteobacteria bacterium]|nr:hypothetical protein [Alphaproteobacteria bacterium]